MSKDNLQRFYELVRQDQTLQKELADTTNADQFAELTVRLGADRGFAFTTDDVKASLETVTARTDELGEAELAAVAGGGDLLLAQPNSIGCAFLSGRLPWLAPRPTMTLDATVC
jgi:predicted ribosomally synthesized peptide with nif11-like leader